MEEKKAYFPSSLWSIFNFRNDHKLFSKRPNNSSDRGFTIVELLVVMGILSALITSALILINPTSQLGKSRDSRRKSDLKQIQSALELYRSDQGAYPSSVPNCSSSLCFGTTVYIQTVPKDPKSSTNYYYSYNASLGTYVLSSCLENTSDTEGTATSPGGPSCNPSYYYVVNNP